MPVVIIESAFTRLNVQTAHTTRVKNYDGSDVITTTTRHKDGVETVSEVTAWPDGRLVIEELVRNISSGKTSELRSTGYQLVEIRTGYRLMLDLVEIRIVHLMCCYTSKYVVALAGRSFVFLFG